MAEHLGRPLGSHEVVHHRDNNPANNKIENLQLMSVSKHSSLTWRNTVRQKIAKLKRTIAELEDVLERSRKWDII